MWSRGIPRLTARVLQVGVIFESNNFLLSFVITTAAAQEVGRSVARCPSIVLRAHRAMESLSMENDVTSPVTSYIGVLMSSELYAHVNASPQNRLREKDGRYVRSRPDTTGSRASRPVDSDDVETRRNPRASAQRAPLDRTNNLRVARPTGREHTQRTLTDSATSEHVW